MSESTVKYTLVLLKTAICLPAATFFLLCTAAVCDADIGLAEWSIETPGKNVIAHADPLGATHGTYLRRAPKPDKPDTDAVVLISHIEWWEYYKGYVVGKAKKGFFVFDEKARAVQYRKDQASLDDRIKQLKLGKPLAKRMTPKDGWKMVWGPTMKRLYQKQLSDLEKGEGTAKDLSVTEREAMKNIVQDMLKELEK